MLNLWLELRTRKRDNAENVYLSPRLSRSRPMCGIRRRIALLRHACDSNGVQSEHTARRQLPGVHTERQRLPGALTHR